MPLGGLPGHSEAVLDGLGPQKPEKLMVFQGLWKCTFLVLPSSPWLFWSPFGASLGCLGDLFGCFRAVFGLSWGRLGAVFGCFRVSWASLGAVLGLSRI